MITKENPKATKEYEKKQEAAKLTALFDAKSSQINSDGLAAYQRDFVQAAQLP